MLSVTETQLVLAETKGGTDSLTESKRRLNDHTEKRQDPAGPQNNGNNIGPEPSLSISHLGFSLHRALFSPYSPIPQPGVEPGGQVHLAFTILDPVLCREPADSFSVPP